MSHSKYFLVAVLFFLSCFSHSIYARGGSLVKCYDNAYVKRLDIGNVGGNMGADNGNAVYVTFGTATTSNSEWLPMKYSANLNDPAGKLMYSKLLTAMLLKLPVTIYDNSSDSSSHCNDFDRIRLAVNK